MMKFDVKGIAKRHDREFKRFQKTTRDVDLLVLKGHLLIEQFLTSLIENYCHKPEFLEDATLTFYNKVKLARCLVMHPMPDDSIWDNIECLNKLRNKLVHEWKPKNREKLIRNFLAFRAKESGNVAPANIDLSTNKKCAEEVSRSVSFLLGALSVLDIVTKFMESQKTYGQESRGNRRK